MWISELISHSSLTQIDVINVEEVPHGGSILEPVSEPSLCLDHAGGGVQPYAGELGHFFGRCCT